VLKDSVRTPLAAACAFESGHLTLIIERRGGLGGGGCEQGGWRGEGRARRSGQETHIRRCGD
jgi:hypothetical protein